jgi:hypothetical protein
MPWSQARDGVLRVGDVTTFAGMYKRRSDRLSKVLALFGIIRYSKELQPMEIVDSCDSYMAIMPVAEYPKDSLLVVEDS